MKNSKYKLDEKYAVKVPIKVYDDISPVVVGDEELLESTKLYDQSFVVLDLETDLPCGRIIHVVAVRIFAGKVTGRFESYIWPGYELPDKLVELTHCSNNYFDKDKSRVDVIKELSEFIGDAVIFAGACEYASYIRELKYNSLKDSTNAWINVSIAVERIESTMDHDEGLFNMLDEIRKNGHSISYNIDPQYVNLCIGILETFTFKNLKTLAEVNEFYKKYSQMKYGYWYYFGELFAIVDNAKGLKQLTQCAIQNGINIDEEYACIEILASELEGLSENISFAVIGGRNRYYFYNLLLGENDFLANEIHKYTSIIQANLMDVIVDKMEDIYSGVVDSEHVRKAYELEIKEYMEKGCLIVPSTVFNNIKTMYFDELYRISRLIK